MIIFEIIDLLNQSAIPYAILRNYDNLLEESLYMDGHGDIDLICQDSEALAKSLKAVPHRGHINHGIHDKVHFFIQMSGQPVSLDLRYCGDGYYCRKWQEEMLERRKLHNGFYVLHEEDYFYTLIYHAVFQKKDFSEEYQSRLTTMAKDLGINIAKQTIPFFVSLLEDFMRKHQYVYTYPQDKHVSLNTAYIQDKKLLKKDFQLWLRHFGYHAKLRFIAQSVRIKHLLKRS